MSMIITVVFMMCLVALLLACWRLVTLRSQGTPVIVRRLPAQGIHGWRHGTLRYRGVVVYYYKVRSLSPSPNLVFNRENTHVISRRALTPEEASFMEPELNVVTVDVAGQQFEVALDPSGEMALTAWVEAAPSRQRIRTSPDVARRYFTNHQD